MPITFACPSCAAVMSAPDNKAGRSAPCPKCGTMIQVPSPGVLVQKPRTRPRVDDDLEPEPPPPRRGSIREAEREALRESPPRRRRDPDYDRDVGEQIERHAPALKYTNSLGITSLILGIVSLPFICMPCVGWIGVGIGCVGMLLGIAGLIQSFGRGGYGIGFPIG